jgi:hypothetical protein
MTTPQPTDEADVPRNLPAPPWKSYSDPAGELTDEAAAEVARQLAGLESLNRKYATELTQAYASKFPSIDPASVLDALFLIYRQDHWTTVEISAGLDRLVQIGWDGSVETLRNEIGALASASEAILFEWPPTGSADSMNPSRVASETIDAPTRPGKSRPSAATIQPIETRYAGCRFRSRLEARWAVFFDTLGIRWEYEPQGFMIPCALGASTPYLPDFLLMDCGTWVEVKGSEADLDHDLMARAAVHLPGASVPNAPTILLLGPIPNPPAKDRDLGWLGLWADEDWAQEAIREGHISDASECVGDAYWGFGGFVDLGAPEQLDISGATAYQMGDEPWLTPCESYQQMNRFPGVPDAYRAARSARFEHGDSP